MEYQVSGGTIAVLIFDLIMGIVIPVGMFVYLNRKKKLSGKPFMIGWLGFLVGVMLVERAFHMLVFASPIGNVLNTNLFLYALYGGIAAGLFEELTRYLCFKRFLKDQLEEDGTALMYGAGHGGCEMFNIWTITMVSNLIYALTLKSQGIAALTAGLEGESLAAVEAMAAELCGTSPWVFLLSLAERLFAIVLQISLSVLVFYAVKNPRKDRKLLLIAVELHALVDFISAIAAQTLPVAVTELIVGAMAVFAAWFAKRIWNQNHAAVTEA
ncbi:MAG: YhfC family intramembrane metalloprotease [Solobacterium sp.]|nr:YhfC family intramembrane metalloprotease [Solobacterium sp.]